MNERIQELAKQAGLTLVPNSKPIIYQGPMSELEKFAELIVRECGQYLNSPEFIGRSDLDWAMVLNEHFGVEE